MNLQLCVFKFVYVCAGTQMCLLRMQYFCYLLALMMKVMMVPVVAQLYLKFRWLELFSLIIIDDP